MENVEANRNVESAIKELDKRDHVVAKLYNDPEIPEEDKINTIDKHLISYARKVFNKYESLKVMCNRLKRYWDYRKMCLTGESYYEFYIINKNKTSFYHE